MLKTRYVAATIGLLIMIFIAVLFFLPNLQVEKATKGNTYTESVFDQSKVTTVDITLADEDLDSILDNPSEKEIVNADVTIDGETVKNVGFRTKGNLSLNSVVQMGDSDRYSWKIDFDYYQEDQDLHGLKKLALNNNYSDPTYMREYLSYELMDKMGIATPGHSYMYVTINGKEWGLYLGVEAIEETFLNTNFTDGTGDLYYPDGTGSDLKWISEDIGDYTGLNLKTNDNSDQSAMIKLLDSINNGGNLEEVLDVDEMLRYFAANTALVNLDHYQGDKKHNYYLYEENGVFSILPWDYNMSFGGYSGGGGRRAGASDQETADQNDGTAVEGNDDDTKQDDKEVLGGAPNMNGGGMMDMSSNFMNESNINFSITEPVSGTALEERPLLNALLSNDEYREKYYDYLNDIATDFFAEENMTAMTTEISTLITPYVKKDPTKFYTMDEYTEATSGKETLVDFAVQRAESILAQLSGDLVVEAETESSMGGGAPTIGDDANAGHEQQPNMGGGENGAAMQPPDMDRGGNGAPPGIDGNMSQKGAGNSSSSKDTIILSSVLLLLLIGAMAFAHFFKRRGKKG
ncbi:CotH kinase family protein [Peribacillus castrilensis]|uniref:CotH kinase family protein n=1 Tax=Bacillaceae TaxID=186817 RepID=UPI0006601985|nr:MULTISPECIES: CotH kinase family protein [Bacillaceae]MCF7625373.1 CotH kinase family protein [Peribacillus frigoritolerans]MCP1095986.1 CotH kinase family protein [Bacillaceae bacterium OS4b]